MPVVSSWETPRLLFVAPGIRCTIEPAPGGVLPLGFGGQAVTGPARVRERVFVGHMHDRVVHALAQLAARPFGRAPRRTGRPHPPLVQVHQILDVRGLLEHQRAGTPLLRRQLRVLLGAERTLGHRSVACGPDKMRKLGIGDLVSGDGKRADRNVAHRCLLGIEAVGAHAERTSGQQHHAGRDSGSFNCRKPIIGDTQCRWFSRNRAPGQKQRQNKRREFSRR